MTGMSQRASHTLDTLQRARNGRSGVLGQLIAEQAIDDASILLAGSVPALS